MSKRWEIHVYLFTTNFHWKESSERLRSATFIPARISCVIDAGRRGKRYTKSLLTDKVGGGFQGGHPLRMQSLSMTLSLSQPHYLSVIFADGLTRDGIFPDWDRTFRVWKIQLGNTIALRVVNEWQWRWVTKTRPSHGFAIKGRMGNALDVIVAVFPCLLFNQAWNQVLFY